MDALPRVIIILAYLIFILNLGEVLGLEAANVVSKGVFLLAAAACVLTRPVTYSVLVLLALCIVMILFLGVATTYPGFSWMTVIMSLNQIIIVYALLAYKPTARDADSFLRAASFFPIVCVVLGMAYNVTGLHSMYATEWGTGFGRLSGTLVPAFLSGLGMCGTFAALQLGVAGKRPAYLAVLAVNLIILLLAGGRMPLAVALVVSGASLMLNRAIPPRIKFYSVAAGTAALFVLVLGFGGTMIERLGASGDNGRLLMWGYLETLAAHYPWTGIGWGHQFLSVPREISIQTGSSAAHNDYLRLLVELGQVGMPLFYLLLTGAVLITCVRDRIGFNWTLLVAYLGFLTISWTDNTVAAPSHFPILILAAIAHRRYGAPAGIQTRRAPRRPNASSQPRRFAVLPVAQDEAQT